MNEQETTDSDKLMIVEASKTRRGGAGISTSPIAFGRQIVGRHVIYKGSDGSNLRSIAEVRRFFKQRGLALDESRFDFALPKGETKRITASTNASGGTSAATSTTATHKTGRGRGRPRVISPPKAASVKRKELADDVKAIKDSLKNNNETDASISTAPPATNQRPRGRPSKQPPKKKAFVESSPVDNSPDAGEGSGGRPSRQRRPNQRYTDLVSETSSPPKKARKDIATLSSPTEEPMMDTALGADITISGSESPFVANTMTLMATPVQRHTGTTVARELAAARLSSPPSISPGLASPPKSKRGRRPKAQTQPKPFTTAWNQTTTSMRPFEVSSPNVIAERIVPPHNALANVSFSPTPIDAFEAPPEFADLHETIIASTPREIHTIQPNAVAASSSSLLYVPQSDVRNINNNSVAPTIRPAIVLPAVSPSITHPMPRPLSRTEPMPPPHPLSRNDMKPTMRRSVYDRPKSPEWLSYLDDEDERRIIRPVRRGRKPGDGMAGLRNNYKKLEISRMVQNRMASESSSSGSSQPSYYNRFNRTTNYDDYYSGPPRGIAKLQRHSNSKQMTIGRYGAASVATSTVSRDSPPLLQPYGADGGVKVQGLAVRRAKDPSDASMFCHLPPEVVGDHCYGRQPDPPPGEQSKADNLTTIVGSIIAGDRERTTSSSSYGSSAPILLSATPSILSRRSYHHQHEQTAIKHQMDDFRTPSPPPYHHPSSSSQRPRTSSNNNSNFASAYPNMVDTRVFANDLGGVASSSSTLISGGSQQMEILDDKLPANILEDDEADQAGGMVTSVSIH